MNRPALTRDFQSQATGGFRALGKVALNRGLAALDKAPHRWPEDRVMNIVDRAAVVPTSATDAAVLAQTAAEFLASLTSMSAGAALMQRGIEISIGANASVSLPTVTRATAKFIGEGQPFPVAQQQSSAVKTIEGYKLGVITVVSSELFTNPGAEAAIRQCLVDSVGPSLDEVLFSAAPGVAQLQPAGILHNVAPLVASSATGNEAMYEDLENIGEALAPVAGNSAICIIAAPKQSVGLAIRMPRELSWPVFTSSSLTPGTLIGVAAAGFVSDSGVPVIDVSAQASLHMDDNALALVSDSPVTVAAPTRGTFQSDTLALRIKFPCTWALRSPQAVAFVQNITAW